MIYVLGNRLLVEPLTDPQTTASGLILRDPDTLATTKCEIVGLGTDLSRRNWAPGMIVIVPKQAFIDARDAATDKTVAISEDDVIAVVGPAKASE